MYLYEDRGLLLCVLLSVVVSAAVVLLLPAAVRYRAPDGKNCCWIIESDSSVLFLFIQTRCNFNVPGGSTVSHFRPRFACMLGIITGMRGAEASISPPRRRPHDRV